MNHTPLELFVVAFAMRPLPHSQEFSQFQWAIVTCWTLAPNADVALDRATQPVLALQWKHCGSKAQVNLARHWKKPIPEKMQAAVGRGFDEVIFEIEGLPVGSTEPDFENVFYDPSGLTIKQIKP